MTYIILLFAFLLTVLGATRLKTPRLRTIPGYERLIRSVSEGVEGGKAAHVAFGSAVGDLSTLSTIATAELLYSVSNRASFGDKPVYASLSDPISLTLSHDVLRKAYKARNRLEFFRGTQVTYFPHGQTALGFAAGAGIALINQDSATNVFAGRFGAELSLLAENAIRTNRTVIAQSDQVDGQAVAYVVSETPLVGEELYAGGAYLGDRRVAFGSLFGQDVIRWLAIVIIVVIAVLTLAGVGV